MNILERARVESRYFEKTNNIYSNKFEITSYNGSYLR